MEYMFYNCKKLISLNLLNFNISIVNDSSYMFYGCSSIENLDLSNFDTSSIVKMNYMFHNCINLKFINISSFNTSKVEYMNYMFSGCSSLISLDLFNFNTLSVKSMSGMFSNCKNLKSIDISSFNTSKVTSMYSMFYNCESLNSLNLSNINTKSVRDMSGFFYGCQNLSFLNISNFDTSNVVMMNNMFEGCFSLLSLDLSNFNTSSINTIHRLGPLNMFKDCRNLKFLNISSFDTSKIFIFDNMFKGCSSLVSLDISNFNTSSAMYMRGMFQDCKKLNILNMSNFDTSNVRYMNYMFSGCSSLSSLNLSNFKTPQLSSLDSMFYNCQNLEFLDLSNFNTKFVTNMSNLFYNCKSLKSLNLSCFNTTFVKYTNNMFSGCENLIYLDLSNFILNNNHNFNSMFRNCRSLIYLNLFQCSHYYFNIHPDSFSNISNHLIYCTNIIKIDDYFKNTNRINNCSDTCFMEDRKIIIDKKKCILNCTDDFNYPFEYKDICYSSCPSGTYNSEDDNFKCDNCFHKCKECNGKGNEINNNCLECYQDMILLNDFNNSNCYEKCNYYYFFDDNGEYHCTNDYQCPEEYKLSKKEENRCIKNIDLYTTYISISTNLGTDLIINNSTYALYEDNINEEIKKKDEEIVNFKEDIMKNENVLDNVTKGEDFIKEQEDMIFQVTTSENQKNNSNKNISSIDLKDCEDKLKEVYKISNSTPLIILKIDYYSKDTNIPIVGYEIYHPTNKSKLDLNYCKDILIKLNIPVNIDESNLFKYDPSSEYYTDNCYSYTTDDGTDIILSDRKKEFGKNNMSLCENNCNYTGYNSENKQSSCDCQVKNKIDLVSEIVDNPQKLSDAFSGESGSSGGSNIITMKCTKALFT